MNLTTKTTLSIHYKNKQQVKQYGISKTVKFVQTLNEHTQSTPYVQNLIKNYLTNYITKPIVNISEPVTKDLLGL